mgnify:CR=1 FL=1
MFRVNFFREDDGSKPVGAFIRTLDVKMKAKVVSDLNRLEMLGNEAKEPLSKHLAATMINPAGDYVVTFLVARFTEGKDWLERAQCERTAR